MLPIIILLLYHAYFLEGIIQNFDKCFLGEKVCCGPGEVLYTLYCSLSLDLMVFYMDYVYF